MSEGRVEQLGYISCQDQKVLESSFGLLDAQDTTPH